MKQNINNFLDKSFKSPKNKKNMVDYQNDKNLYPKLYKNKKKKTKTKTPFEHFKNFLTDYTENIRFKKPNSKKDNEKKSKKCKKSTFIKPMNNLSNNHNLF